MLREDRHAVTSRRTCSQSAAIALHSGEIRYTAWLSENHDEQSGNPDAVRSGRNAAQAECAAARPDQFGNERRNRRAARTYTRSIERHAIECTTRVLRNSMHD